SFGFHEGFNWGMPVLGFMAMQWGGLWTQNNFDGNYLTPDVRYQTFVTGGAFRRVDWGFQGGVVVDYFHDDWDFKADLLQLRGELSWLDGACNEFGFWFTSGLNNASNLQIRQPTFGANGVTFATTQSTIEVNSLYAFFYRRQLANCGQGRFFGGFTGHQQGLVGADLLLPINPNWSVRSAFIYVIPEGSNTATDPRFAQESWNVGITLIYSWCPRSVCGPNYCRPLFNVADNGSFI